jgi:actin-related protein
MKIILLCIILFCTTLTVHSQNATQFTFRGSVDYTQQRNQQLINVIGNDFKVKIFESSDKKYMWFFGGSIEHNYNIFQSSYHINGFGRMGIEY